MHQNAAFAVQAIRAGAMGYVTKTSPPETLVSAVMDVLAGQIAISPDIDHELALSRSFRESRRADVLTAREFEVLRMLLAERTHRGNRRRRFTSVRRPSRTCTPSSRTSLASAPTSSLSGLRCDRKF